MGIGQKDFLEEVRTKLVMQGLPGQESQRILQPSSLGSNPMYAPHPTPMPLSLDFNSAGEVDWWGSEQDAGWDTQEGGRGGREGRWVGTGRPSPEPGAPGRS